MSPSAVEIRVGMGSCGIASGSEAVAEALADEIARVGSKAKLVRSGCMGLCFAEPLVEVVAEGRSRAFGKVTPPQARRLVRRLAPGGMGLRRLMGIARSVYDRFVDDEAWLPSGANQLAHESGDDAALDGQTRIALADAGTDDPLDIEAYEKSGGLEALAKASRMQPEDIVEIISRSGLRGRGGAGFPAGTKWRLAREARGRTKYVICNGDEGDPGAFMDRSLLESAPFKVLEGLAIAARAVGASEAWVYVRAEYPLAVERLRAAVSLLEERGVLGKRAEPPLEVHVFVSAGAFVCGEETALISAIEGERGTPRARPPYPAERGLWGRPTLINNVETLTCVPWIITNGPERFAALGTDLSKGTKVFALAGAVRRGGLIEAPMGMTIREIVERIGGGPPEGRRFKAVQIGGPSGGCLPAELADTPIDFEALQEQGSIMGSGGLVVLDDTTCMVDFARFFIPFMLDESCGKCTFCRVGLKRILEILDKLCEGRARPADLDRLEELSKLVADASFCGLGRSAPNPVITSLRYFRGEYEAHLDGRCPAGKCAALVTYSITEKCIGCTLCAQGCPVKAIEPRPYERQEIDAEKCIRCGLCRTTCPEGAIDVT